MTPAPYQPIPARKVLIVDDEELILRIVTIVLSNAGFEVKTAADGATGLELFSKDSWDLVITDQMMPGRKGEELAAAIREKAPSLPIILMTGFRKQVGAPELFTAVLDKPFTREALLTSVNGALKSNTT